MNKKLNKIDKLINELCPEGVEFKELEKVADVKTGSQLNKTAMFDSGKYLVLNGGINPSGYYDEYNTEADTIAISQGGASAGYVNFICEKFWAGAHCFVVRLTNKDVLNKFIYFVLKEGQEKLMQAKLGAGIPGLNRNELRTFKIPIPHLPIQEEIVKILDNFTELEAELKAELEARKKQYFFYENEILFNNNYELKKISDLCIVNQGLQIPISERKKESGKNRYFYITIQFLKKNNGEKYYIENPDKNVICKMDDILVTRTGSTGKIITGVEGCFHNNFFKVNCFNIINKRYMYYVLKSKKIYNKLLHLASGGTVPDLPHRKFYQIIIPIPPLPLQEEIVKTLDKFDALVNDISIGLPAELSVRKKQYEYYREKLLTFNSITN